MRARFMFFFLAALLVMSTVVCASDMESFSSGKISVGADMVGDSVGNATGIDGVSGIQLEQPAATSEFRKSLAGNMKPALGEYDSKEAMELHQQFRNNPEIQGMIKSYTKNIWEQLDQQARESGANATPLDRAASEAYMANNAAIEEYTGRHVYVFVSDSMPKETIDNYIETIEDNPNFVMVLRGPIGGEAKMIPTVDWVSRRLCGKSAKEMMAEKISNPDEAGCKKVTISLDGNLFEKFRVQQVPAIVYVPSVETSMKCNHQYSVEEGEYFSFFGDVPVRYALNKIRMALPDDQKLVEIIDSLAD